MKHALHIKHYFRYADDFIFLHEDRRYLCSTIQTIEFFLRNTLKLHLHPHKIFLRKFSQGIDFVGYVCFPHHRILRTKTKQRMVKRLALREMETACGDITQESFNQTFQSYFGLLEHANSFKLKKSLNFPLDKKKKPY